MSLLVLVLLIVALIIVWPAIAVSKLLFILVAVLLLVALLAYTRVP